MGGWEDGRIGGGETRREDTRGVEVELDRREEEEGRTHNNNNN